MLPLPNNRAVIAAAGSLKTQYIIDSALDAPADQRSLITTYTTANCEEITSRICKANGYVPPNITILPWFTFLINQGARPYQSTITGQIDYIRSLNFKGQHFRGTPRAKPLRYYFDPSADFYRDGVAEFVVQADIATDGKVVRRLESLYDNLYVDEFQDLCGYDLDFLDLLFSSSIDVTIVGDPRQYTYATSDAVIRNTKYRGPKIVDWLAERPKVCPVEHRAESWRCNQEICDWADALYPGMSPTTSHNLERTGHDGVFPLAQSEVPEYVKTHQPTVLRWDRTINTHGLPARNMKGSKGCTFNRVLIFPTESIRRYLINRDPAALDSRPALYVAVTRARHSVAFVMDRTNVAIGQTSLFDDAPYILGKAS